MLENGQKVNVQQNKQAKNTFAKFLYSVLVIFAVVFSLSTFFGRVLFYPIKVEGLSMQPTLNAQAYGETDHCDTVYLGSASNISRGDIVVFNASNYTNSSSDTLYIKRAIGLPGDTIHFATNGTEKNGKIYYDVFVNSVKIEESYIKEPMWFDSKPGHHSQADLDFYTIFVLLEQKIVLGDNEFFLMGDNRNNSTDSRFLGSISKSDFIGKVYLQIQYGQTLFEALIKKIF